MRSIFISMLAFAALRALANISRRAPLPALTACCARRVTAVASRLRSAADLQHSHASAFLASWHHMLGVSRVSRLASVAYRRGAGYLCSGGARLSTALALFIIKSAAGAWLAPRTAMNSAPRARHRERGGGAAGRGRKRQAALARYFSAPRAAGARISPLTRRRCASRGAGGRFSNTSVAICYRARRRVARGQRGQHRRRKLALEGAGAFSVCASCAIARKA